MQNNRPGHKAGILSASVRAACAAACACSATGTYAVDLSRDDLNIRWDNTVKYAAGYRLKDPKAHLISNINLDDGDRAFKKGLMTNRIDLLSEFDIQKNGFGVRLSGAAWYDAVYNRANDNTSPATANQTSVAYNQFTRGTRNAAGRDAEVLDAFVFGKVDLEGSRRLSVRLGQYSMLWGNTLFFAANGIAKGMAPVDVYKLNLPGTQSKEALLPVKQMSATLNLSDSTSIEAYYQFNFRPTRLAPAGSYFSPTDWMGDGGERFLFGPGFGVQRGSDINGKHEPNIGVALNTRSELLDTDFGFYATRFQDTSPQTVMQPAAGRYFLAYPQNVRSLGVGAARLLGDANVSGEFSVRWGQPLWAAQTANIIGSPLVNAANLDLANNSMWPTARTAHFNVSTVWILPTSQYWGGATLIGEFMANKVLAYENNAANIDPSRRRGSAAARVIFSPTYYQLVPGFNVSPSVNLGWSFYGKSMIDGGALPFGGSPHRGGDLVLGINADYQSKYNFGLTWTHYLGNETQPFLDRDYIRFAMKTAF